jgi:antirestriction protein ArdC
MRKTYNKKAKKNHYEEVTKSLAEAIERSLEDGTHLPWNKPWRTTGGPHNGGTKHRYRGINTLIIAFTPFADPRWYSFNQIKAMGGSIKGQKSTTILRPFPIFKKDENGNKTKELAYMSFNGFPIWNKEQIEGVDFPELEVSTNNNERHELAEEVIKDTGANISFGGDRACYIPNQDKVLLPSFDSFDNSDMFYNVAFHELGHWTGNESRLDRDQKGNFGSPEYGFEELVAELTASFVCRDLAIDSIPMEHTTAYMKGWLKTLKSDVKFIFRASSLAEAAAKEILGDHQPNEEEQQEEEASV